MRDTSCCAGYTSKVVGYTFNVTALTHAQTSVFFNGTITFDSARGKLLWPSYWEVGEIGSDDNPDSGEGACSVSM